MEEFDSVMTLGVTPGLRISKKPTPNEVAWLTNKKFDIILNYYSVTRYSQRS